jgi:hypothetical protein
MISEITTLILQSYLNVLNVMVNLLFKQKEKMNHNDVNAMMRASICAHALVKIGSWEFGDAPEIKLTLVEELAKAEFDPQPVMNAIDNYFKKEKE